MDAFGSHAADRLTPESTVTALLHGALRVLAGLLRRAARRRPPISVPPMSPSWLEEHQASSSKHEGALLP